MPQDYTAKSGQSSLCWQAFRGCLTFLSEPRSQVAFIFGLALSIRIAYLLWNYHSFGTALPYSDDRSYDNLAINMLQGFGYSTDGDPSYSMHRMPGYPTFLALVYFLFGHNYLVARLALGLLGAFTAVLVFFIATKVFNRTVGLLAGLLLAIYMPYIHQATSLYAETFFIFLLCLLCLPLLQLMETPTGLNAIKIGGAMGLVILTRSTGIALLPLVPICSAIRTRSVSNFIRTNVLAITLVLAVLTPWLVRNYWLSGHLVLSTQGGPILYDASMSPGYTSEQRNRLLWNPEFVNLSLIERNRILRKLALENIRQHPGHYLGYCWQRFSGFWHPGQFFQAESRLLIFPFMVAGFLAAFKRWPRTLPLLYLLLAFTAIHTLLEGRYPYGTRYRLQVEWILVIFAAYGIYLLLKICKRNPFSEASSWNVKNFGSFGWSKRAGWLVVAFLIVMVTFWSTIIHANFLESNLHPEPNVTMDRVDSLFKSRGLWQQWQRQEFQSVGIEEIIQHKKAHRGSGKKYYGTLFIWDGKINYIERHKAYVGNKHKHTKPQREKTAFMFAVNAFSKPHYVGDFRIRSTYHGLLAADIRDGDRVKIVGRLRCDGNRKGGVMLADIYGVFH